MQTNSLIFGRLARSASTAGAKACWKNNTSQSNASSNCRFSSSAPRGLTGIHAMPARHSPSVQVQGTGWFAAQTAPTFSRPRPIASKAFAMRHESVPTSSKL
ncbi:hypothetical protein D3C86_1745370 [compost metagenome]